MKRILVLRSNLKEFDIKFSQKIVALLIFSDR